jgi:hypothetical protein
LNKENGNIAMNERERGKVKNVPEKCKKVKKKKMKKIRTDEDE